MDSESTVFHHGEISFSNGTILCVGEKGECASGATGNATIVDLQGKAVLPGLIDAHVHPIDAGRAMLSCSLRYRQLVLAQLLSTIQQCLDNEPNATADSTLTVSEWDREGFTDLNGPANATMLDQLNTTRPVMLIATSQHNVWLNTRGLQVLNITATTPNPDGGRIVKDSNGFPTGVLEENAAGSARALSGDRGVSHTDAAIAALAVLRRQGYTTILNALASPIQGWKDLSRENQLTARVFNAFGVFGSVDFPLIAAQARNASQQLDDGVMVASRPGEFWRHVKFFVDGILSAVSQSSLLMTPHLVNNTNTWTPGTNFGIPGATPEQLESLFTSILGINLGLHLHASGDAAVRQVLTVAARMNRTFTPSQVAIAHAELVHPDDLAEFAALGIPAVMSYQWAQKATYWNELTQLTLGAERMSRVQPHSQLISAGGLVAFGSDWPVDPLDTFLALKVGVTRNGDASNPNSHSSFGPQFVGRLDAQTALTREQALRGMTSNAAAYLEQQQFIGSLERGKFADIIVIEEDFMNATVVHDDAIARNRVLLTLVGGRPVWANASWIPQAWTQAAQSLDNNTVVQRLKTSNILPRSITGRQCMHGSHGH
ncbi:hypothetical protein ACHAQA_006687 [Verticillium albo-atrum]